MLNERAGRRKEIEILYKKIVAADSSLVSGNFCSGGATYGMGNISFLKRFFYFGIYVLAVGIFAHFVGEAIPRKFDFEKGYFSSAGWEDNGKIYDKVFRISKWKDKLLDASKGFASTAGKGLNMMKDPAKVGMVIQESCAAEATHLGILVLSPLMLLLPVGNWIWLFFGCYVLFNLADIMIQRYNRPRIVQIYQRILRK